MSHQAYYFLSNYEILQFGNVEKLRKHRKSNDDPIQYYVHIEETFAVIKFAYITTGQEDLINMQPLPHGYFKWIIVHQDNLTKSAH